MIEMCEFCERSQEDIKLSHEWVNANPYQGNEQVYDGLDWVLDGDIFTTVAMFDGGYIHDKLTFKFRYCPMCGRKL